MPDVRDIANEIAIKANRYKDHDKILAYDHVAQLLAAVKHPVVGKGVYNAAINRWGWERFGMDELDSHCFDQPFGYNR
jgi:hypothetical protein